VTVSGMSAFPPMRRRPVTWPEEGTMDQPDTAEGGKKLARTLLCVLILAGVAIVILATGLVLALQGTADQKSRLDIQGGRLNEQQTQLDRLQGQLDHQQLEIDRLQNSATR
jgi:uncharacterized protein HemX